MAAHGEGSKVEMLQEGISARQQELQRVADILARAAQKFRRNAAWIRILLILCGAIAATQSAWEQTFTGYREYAFLIFTSLGVLIAVLAGIEAAFKFEAKGAELNLLAASCHSTVRKTDAAWYKYVGIAANPGEQVTGAMSLIELQDTKLSEIQEKAAASGVNIILAVRSLYGGAEVSYAEENPNPSRGPYAA
ncbi:MAG: hypothetical protein EHM45_15635 [Desulfobacteraceae bacterium]|nr:MAG: hypothetical protein EHM45_15635 [Desulfobacteraceae bacterium]